LVILITPRILLLSSNVLAQRLPHALLQIAASSVSTSSPARNEAAAGNAPSTSGADPAVWQHRSRLEVYYNTIVARELVLKTNITHHAALPRLKRIDLAVQAVDVYGKSFAEKWQMLVHGLGLEFVTGLKTFYAQQHGKQFRGGNTSAARVTLRGSRMYDFLEKLIVLALPNQVGFMGFDEDAIDSQGNLSFKLGNLLNFPEFEDHFDTFEELKSVHVCIVVENTNREYTRMLLSALHFPFASKDVEEGS
jgi:large subunit ribosomal protein L5